MGQGRSRAAAIPADDKVKLIVISWGQWGVGKSSIQLRACANEFFEGEKVEYSEQFQRIEYRAVPDMEIDQIPFYIRFTDSYGQERFGVKHITYGKWRGHIALFCYDVGNRESFDKIDEWVKQSQEYTPPYAVKVLCGLKADTDAVKAVSTSEGETKTHQLRLDSFYELSSKENIGIREMLIDMARVAHEKIKNRRMLRH